jgi:glycosyltransferase involved in cell wall biosynthesis
MTGIAAQPDRVTPLRVRSRAEVFGEPADGRAVVRPGRDSVRISICIPAYNEAGGIERTVQDAVETLTGIKGRHELIVVDDGSTDGTGEILARLAQQHPVLRAVRHPRNRGCSAGLQTAVEAARGEYLFETAADGQWRMAELPKMLETLERGFDVVIGARQEKQYTWQRKVVSAGFNWLVALLWGKHFGDLGSIRLTRAALWKRIPFGSGSAFGSAERLIIAYRNGARIGTVPVSHRPRAAGRSNFGSLRPVFLALSDLVRFWFSARSRYRVSKALASTPPRHENRRQ